MTNFSSRLYELSVTYKMATHRHLLEIVERQLEEDFQTWQRETAEAKIEITGDDHLQWYVDKSIDESLERDVYMGIFLSSLFVSSFAMFEHELMRIYDYVKRDAMTPFSVKDFERRDYMESAKDYLKKLGVVVPADTLEWKQATNYRTIRNKIMHEGGYLGESDGILCFATENEILIEHQVIKGTKEFDLRLTREFCDRVLNDMERVQLQVNAAYRQWLQDRVQ